MSRKRPPANNLEEMPGAVCKIQPNIIDKHAQKANPMATVRDIVHKHVEAALAEAAAQNHSPDTVARVLFDEVIKLYRIDRTAADIASELMAAAENLDADEGIAFMRP